MIISNRYKLIKRLGEGGFGEVWLAEDQTSNRQVALKLYKITGSGHDELVREFNQVYGLDSVNLVKAYHVDRDEAQGFSYLVMDYCRYGSLDQMIGQINEREVWRCLRDIASGLVALSEHTVFDEKQQREVAAPVVHQDLKPANILIRKHDKDGHNVYAIADFGISKTSVSQKSGSSIFVSAGTLAYMGPERFFPSYRPRVESDIWSLGAMLYELVEGKTPFPTMDTLSGGNWLNQEGVELPKIKNSAISSNLCDLIYLCMAKEPENRPTAKQLYNYVEKVLSDDTVHPKPKPKPHPNKLFQFINSYWLWMVLSIMVLLLGVLAIVMNTNKAKQELAVEPVVDVDSVFATDSLESIVEDTISLATEKNVPKQHAKIGDILCTDGSWVSPNDYATSSKTALGVIFHVDDSGEHGWAVHLQEQGEYSWSPLKEGSTELEVSGLPHLNNEKKALLDKNGFRNTQIIRNAGNAAIYPAVYAVDFANGWYLPAIGQMKMLYNLRKHINSSLTIVKGQEVKGNWYWSSTQEEQNYVWTVYNDGTVDALPKYYNHGCVRAVRSF